MSEPKPLTDDALRDIESEAHDYGDKESIAGILDGSELRALLFEVRRHREIAAALVSDDPDSSFDSGIVEVRRRVREAVSRVLPASRCRHSYRTELRRGGVAFLVDGVEGCHVMPSDLVPPPTVEGGLSSKLAAAYGAGSESAVREAISRSGLVRVAVDVPPSTERDPGDDKEQR